MSRPGLKKALDFVVDRATQRRESAKKKKDAQARRDLEKEHGQIYVINKNHQAAIIYKEFGIRLTLTERTELFNLIDAFYKGKQALVKFDSPQERNIALANAEKAKTKAGDFAYLVTNFEQAKTLKYKSKNSTDASQIQANYINNLERRSNEKPISAAQISRASQVGHGDRGISSSQFALDRAVEEASEKFNLSDAEVKQLRTIASISRKKHNIKVNMTHSQFLTSGGKFKKDFNVILSSQYFRLNTEDARRERAAFEETLQEYTDIINNPTSTPVREAVIEVVLEAFAGKPAKNKKVTGKRKKAINEKSNASKPVSRSEETVKRYAVFRGVETDGIQAPKKEKASKRTSFVQLQGLLNAKLPQTVAANMGEPRLENRTGTFASSVRVTEIQKTPKGFASIGYTYQKDPYSVFERTSGTRFASADRDPRDLIDLSIREIAQQMAIGRFYTRRV